MRGFLAKRGFFFWSGLNSIGIDEVDVGFYPEARLRGKADSYSIRDKVSTLAEGFLRFLLNISECSAFFDVNKIILNFQFSILNLI